MVAKDQKNVLATNRRGRYHLVNNIMTKKTYILDTNVYLTDSNSLFKFGSSDIIIPLKVLEEVDKHKNRQDGVGLNARNFIRVLDDLRSKGNLNKGVRIDKGLGIVKAKTSDPSILPPDFDITMADNLILACALSEKKESPTKKVIVVSLDINLRVRCDALGILCESYTENQIVKRTSEIFEGYSELLIDDQIIDRFYAGEDIYLEETPQTKDFLANQFIILISSANVKKSGIARFTSFNKPLKKIKEYVKGKEGTVFGLVSKNKEQLMALNLLMDPEVPIVTLMGRAGTGKTLLAIASALEHVINGEVEENNQYHKIIVSRPIMPMGKDLGFLPGTAEEKMAPWIAPIQDNLDTLFSGKRDKKHDPLEFYKEKGTIQVEALTYIRGRSLNNAYIIVDECQNMTMHEIKTILTRVGENTKIVLTGDVEQIDNLYLNETTNGLTYAIERLKGSELSGHITLIKGERSKVATLAARVL
jgi:PhoH-like ATPase